jgi:transposase InsO family protein
VPRARGLPERLLGVVQASTIGAAQERCQPDGHHSPDPPPEPGHRRRAGGVHAELRDTGTRCSRKRVARLMRSAGREGVPRRRLVRTTVRDRDAAPAPDLVKRVFRAACPNALWVADITYVPTWSGFLHVAVVVDAFSRLVVGWSARVGARKVRPR